MKASRVRPSDIALLALTAATLVFFGLWQMGSLEAKADRIELRRIRAERLMASIDSAGWEARLVDATEGLEAQLQEARESGALLAEEKADLAAEVETLGGELRAMADMYVELAGSIRTHDATVHVSDTAAVQPDFGHRTGRRRASEGQDRLLPTLLIRSRLPAPGRARARLDRRA